MSNNLLKLRLAAILVFAIGAAIAWFVYSSQVNNWKPFKLGLDLSGGTQLVYRANISAIPAEDVADSLASLRDTIERRVNQFGVAEPIVQLEHSSALANTSEDRLIVELPGVTDTATAIRLLGQTPVLEFRMMKQGATSTVSSTTPVSQLFDVASITGKDLASSEIQFQGAAGIAQEPVVVLHFNSAGATKFAALTKNNVGKVFGIFLDGSPISTPVIREEIPDGTAVISGSFTATQAKELARNLNYGALPVPIELISTQTVAGTLGEKAVSDGLKAGIFGLIAVAIFMLVWYRLPGLIACVALLFYVALSLALYKIIPVTLTAAGIAAFILSVGMAVDANILIFERTREELALGKTPIDAIREGFARAWNSIRDSNISSIITAIILFWFGTSLIKGFALVFGLGVLTSMLTAVTISRTLLMSLGLSGRAGLTKFLLSSGINR